MKVFTSPVMQSISSFYGNLLFFDNHASIHEHLYELAGKLWLVIEQKNWAVLQEINNYHLITIPNSWV